MSRIAKIPIKIPAGVAVAINESSVTTEGPEGKLSFNLTPGINIEENQGKLNVRTAGEIESTDKHVKCMLGTTRSILQNMITGVAVGFKKRLIIVGVGYRAQAQGQKLNLSLGFSHPVSYDLPVGVTAVTPTQTEIILSGADKQVVGQTAAEIRAFRPPEPYKGKGVRYADELVIRKQAKKK